MKKVKLNLVIVLILSIYTKSTAQEKWLLSFEVEPNVINSFDIIKYKASIKNITNENQIFKDIHYSDGAFLQIRAKDSIQWQSIDDPYIEFLRRTFCGSYGERIIKSGDSTKTFSRCLLLRNSAMDNSYFLVPKNNQDYELRLVIYLDRVAGSLITSNTQLIKIRKSITLNESDNNARDWLEKQENPYFIHALINRQLNFRWGKSGTKVRNEYKKFAEELIKQHPRSSYTLWAKIILAKYEMRNFEFEDGKKDNRLVKNQIRKAEKIISTIENQIKSRDVIENLGEIEVEALLGCYNNLLNDIESSKRVFNVR